MAQYVLMFVGSEEWLQTSSKEEVQRGYAALKFDPFGTAWKEMTPAEMAEAEHIVAAVRPAVGE